MKRKLWAAWLLTSLLLPWGALAQETFDGTVVEVRTDESGYTVVAEFDE